MYTIIWADIGDGQRGQRSGTRGSRILYGPLFRHGNNPDNALIPHGNKFANDLDHVIMLFD